MSEEKRKLIIDTDTASDDAVAIIMALREPSVEVLALTVVNGNIPLKLATRNCLIAVEQAGTYTPPVYVGHDRPLMREAVTAEACHGQDGLGDVGYPDPKLTTEKEHAVDAIIRILEENPAGTIELVTLGPLTNIAAAFMRAPGTMKKLKQIIIMGGQLYQPGNWSVTSEFNIFVDAEACDVVLRGGVPFLISPVELCYGDCGFDPQERAEIAALSPTGKFAIDCNRAVVEFVKTRYGRNNLQLADPSAMGVALWPDIRKEVTECFIAVELGGKYCYGQMIFDYKNHLKLPANGAVCLSIDVPLYKKRLKEILK